MDLQPHPGFYLQYNIAFLYVDTIIAIIASFIFPLVLKMPKKSSLSQGRPKSTPLEAATRKAVAAKKELMDTEASFEESLSLSKLDAKSARGKEIRRLANKRLKVAKELTEVLDAKKPVRKALKDAKKGAATTRLENKYEALKDKESELYRELALLPELGVTQHEWDNDYSEEEKKRQLGRPTLTIEIELIRARKNQKETQEKLRALETKNKVDKPVNLRTAALKLSETVAKGRLPGKPRLDELGLLDQQLRNVTRKISMVKNKEDIKGVTVLSHYGKEMGRKRKPISAKLKPLMTEKVAIEAAIKKKEGSLSASGKLRRQVKKLRDEARQLKLKANTETVRAAQNRILKQYESKRLKASKLEAEADSLEVADTTKKRKHAVVKNNTMVSVKANKILTRAKEQELHASEKALIEAEIKKLKSRLQGSKNKGRSRAAETIN